MTKVTTLADIYKLSVQEYTKTPAEWRGLLSCLARFYKRSFDNAVLIYAQKPNATQLATFDEWHDPRINRNINKGAKGIGVIDMSNPKASIKYLFDLTDTNGNWDSFRNLQRYHWELEDQYRPSLLNKFYTKYATPILSIEACLNKMTEQYVIQILPRYMENFKVQDESSVLYDAPLDAVKAEFIQLVTDSVAYTVFTKCGISTEMFEDSSFQNIRNYNSLELFMALGSFTATIARPILREINQEIENIKSERSKVHENRTVNESDLQQRQGRDAVSKYPNFSKRDERQIDSGQIRADVEGIHGGEPSTTLIGVGVSGQNKRNDTASGRGSRTPQGDINTAALTDPANAKHRGDNSESSPHEYDNHYSRGTTTRGSVKSKVVQTTKPFTEDPNSSVDGFFVLPPKVAKKTDVAVEVLSSYISAIRLPEEKVTDIQLTFFDPELDDKDISNIVDVILCADDITPDTKEWTAEICEFFQGNHKLSSKANFIKAFYGKLDTDYITKTSDYVKIKANENGLIFYMDEKPFFYPFSQLAEKVDSLILNGIYPFSIEENSLDDYNIPDEIHEMQGVNGNDVEIEIDHVQVNNRINISWEEDMNYRYSEEHHLYDGGPKTKCKNNISAIRLLKEMQSQGRKATNEEQITLAKFVGWGGLANALTPNKSGWEKEFEEIRNLLTAEEFQAAQKSTTTAYYTEQSVIRQMYIALERFGFRGGNILDPAMATGNFYSVIPETMSNSKLYGVELEPISGTIASYLYPNANILITGFERTQYPDHFFDVVIGNIPFNSIKVEDPRYNKNNFHIHDYFLAKSMDKTRPGGIVAVISSMYTLDKANPSIRKYLAQRSELMGAIRLPNNAFKQVAGTESTTDILFFQKRERDIIPDEINSPWLSVEKNEDGIPMNSYFIDHPEMILGKMVFDESMFGNVNTTACHPLPDDDLSERLERAISYLEGSYIEAVSEYEDEKEPLLESIPAIPNVRNYSYIVVEDALYFRENSRMYKQNITGRKEERIRGMVEITAAIRKLIDFQNGANFQINELSTFKYESQLQEYIQHLNVVYDQYVKKYGYINSYGNVIAYSKDSNAPLIRSIELEIKGKKGEFAKTAIFYKATIRPKTMPNVVHSADEALKISLNVKGKVDLEYMSWLYQTSERRKATPDEIIEELGDKLFQDPSLYMPNTYSGWQTAQEYLSGHVKDKLTEAILKADEYPQLFSRNVDALKLVQPTPLTPQEISFTLGSTWIPTEIYQQFMYDTFKTMKYNQSGRDAIVLEYTKYGGSYHIDNKSGESKSVTVNKSYGTNRLNAYEILESSLNLRSVEVKDRVDYVDLNTGEDKVKYVLNKKETIFAREKQAGIKVEFERWLFADSERGVSLTKLYNDRFNNIRHREYNGDALILPDMSEDIHLRKHQLDVIAHGLFSDGNLLAAHEVGAGKTFAGVALGYEMKRLGAVNKPLYAVPNHLVGEWAKHFMVMYPNANILVAEKKDLEKKNRHRFVSRIATGDYHAIIMAHSSFELIGLSRERQLAVMQAELDAVTDAIAEAKYHDGKDWSLKQMQVFRSNLQFRYDKLFNAEKKDDVINFEELGVDALIVDEAHIYKNNFSYTKMRNVAGVSGTSSQRAMDMHMKCQYINEIGKGKGVVYLTGTPISNSMAVRP